MNEQRSEKYTKGKFTYLPLSIAENNSLCDGKRVVQITQCVKFPFLTLNSNKELLDTFKCQFITVTFRQKVK